MKSISEYINLKKQIANPLLAWGLINFILGAFYLIIPSDLIKGILLQAFFWGLIDAILGLGTYFRKKEIKLVKIKKIFLVNTYLDILYVIVGILIILLGNDAFIIGNGYGLIVQGVFLFIVDLTHNNHIKRTLIKF